MKILYHHRIASKDGQYVHVEEVIQALKHLGHEVIIVGPRVSENARFGSDGGWVSTLRAALPKFISELLEFSYSFYVFIKLITVAIKHKPDVIYERYNLFMPSGMWVKKLLKLNIILEVNSPLYLEREKYGGIRLKKLAKWTEQYTWQSADHVCPVTHVLADYLRKAGVPDQNITVIPNGIDPTKFSIEKKNKRIDQFENKLTIGFVGFCREWHQLDKILSLIANANNPNLMLLIIGDGPSASLLQSQASQLGVHQQLHITGLVERKDIPFWLDQIDIALQPSVTPWASPLKLIEYLAKGKAIVAPNSVNIKELLSNNINALLYDENKPEEALQCINRIITDDNLRIQLQHGARKTIDEKRLTWENNAKQIEALIK